MKSSLALLIGGAETVSEQLGRVFAWGKELNLMCGSLAHVLRLSSQGWQVVGTREQAGSGGEVQSASMGVLLRMSSTEQVIEDSPLYQQPLWHLGTRWVLDSLQGVRVCHG